ncbi:MAG: CvpA family protein [Amphiplicatus sp.]
MTSFDLLVIMVLALSILFAVIRGAIREIGTLGVLAAAALAAFLLIKPLQGLFKAGDSFLATLAIGGAVGAAAFVFLYILLHVALSRLVLSKRARRADRIAGGVFGLVRGLALVGLGFLAYAYYLDEDRRPESVNKAMTLPVAKAMADFFEGFAPAGTKLAPAAPKATPAENAAVEGYGRADRSALAEIVTTVTTSADKGSADEASAEPGDDPIAEILKEGDSD